MPPRQHVRAYNAIIVLSNLCQWQRSRKCSSVILLSDHFAHAVCYYNSCARQIQPGKRMQSYRAFVNLLLRYGGCSWPRQRVKAHNASILLSNLGLGQRIRECPSTILLSNLFALANCRVMAVARVKCIPLARAVLAYFCQIVSHVMAAVRVLDSASGRNMLTYFCQVFANDSASGSAIPPCFCQAFSRAVPICCVMESLRFKYNTLARAVLPSFC